jgi:hypothetical protein
MSSLCCADVAIGNEKGASSLHSNSQSREWNIQAYLSRAFEVCCHCDIMEGDRRMVLKYIFDGANDLIG